MSSFKKYKCLTISEKKKVIESVEEGERKIDVGKTFEIPLSSLSTILKNKEKIFSVSSSRVRKRVSKDNCIVHNNAPPLSKVKLQFFSPNSTSKLQPLDQSIMHNFKTFYRREVDKSVLDNLENQPHVTTISILTALIMIDKSWRAVTPLTIHSCFKKSGFPSPNLVDVDNTLTEFNAEPSLWEALPEQDLTFDDYVLSTRTLLYGELYLTLKLWLWTTIVQKVMKTNRRS
ncbi:tigger transposable element-derived protein 6 [Trichonephila clavipes]|uniref:Tigger transposable element-derived protein 6 n=1 Tax=Trichonephila clavipes TaxID=2585209 RepID=A0A8X6STF0_TRICX|nr:tigger transposable element-derived protein 6 [Trichonephila clavipes]